jgi:hypothetical protein
MTNRFKVGDKVIYKHHGGHCVAYKGEIVEDKSGHYFWSHIIDKDGDIVETELAKHPPLAFKGERNYFAWLHNAESYLTHI